MRKPSMGVLLALAIFGIAVLIGWSSVMVRIDLIRVQRGNEEIRELLQREQVCPAPPVPDGPLLNGYDLSDCLGYEEFLDACFTAHGQLVGSTYPEDAEDVKAKARAVGVGVP
jgi:hypothetical protein